VDAGLIEVAFAGSGVSSCLPMIPMLLTEQESRGPFVSHPAETDLKALLSSAYPDPRDLARAIAGLRGLGLEKTTAVAAARNADTDVDLLRRDRCGFAEVIYGEGKSAEQILRIMQQLQTAGQDILATRINRDTANRIVSTFPKAEYSNAGRTIRLMAENDRKQRDCGTVVVLTAGSTDLPVAAESLETLRWMRVPSVLLQDAGVAGPHRLQQHLPQLQSAAAIVCVAGMEAALPSVVGGYVSCPVIGVPTSVGYGASLGGITAMLSMLTCCASNVVCVNIDAGFKGGYTAGLIASRTQHKGIAP